MKLAAEARLKRGMDQKMPICDGGYIFVADATKIAGCGI